MKRFLVNCQVWLVTFTFSIGFTGYYPALRCPQLPCLHVGKKTGTIYLPMEVCHIVKGQRAFHRLTDKQQKTEMIRHTAMKPSVRFRKIQETVSLYNFF